ncbi:alpha/beta fold hydrolase [Dokdonia sp.]|uniref:alpha/beta hydrolase n=1 Tax=Dokdonia sp. TaxID=2024995 RepID=UPI003265D7CA
MMYQTNGLVYDRYTTVYNCEEFFYKVDTTVTLHGVLFKPDSIPPIGTIFHFPGGGMHIPNSELLYKSLLEKGFQIFNYERRNLGQSTGIANNSKVLLKDALYVFDQVLQQPQVKNTPVVLWGQSMGGPYAISVAKMHQDKIKGLILEGTFSSFPDIGKEFAGAVHLKNFTWLIPLIMNNDFPSEEAIQELYKPTVIIHSTNDETVPYKLGEKLYNASNKEHTEFWQVDSRHIRALYDYEPTYISKFNQLINN